MSGHDKGIAAYVVGRSKTVASPGQPARQIRRQKFSAKKKNGHPGVGAWPEGCRPKASRQQWRHLNRTASAFIFYFTADNAPSGTRNLSKRFNGDLGGERRADGRTPGDYHVA